jgi:hypothetical protein
LAPVDDRRECVGSYAIFGVSFCVHLRLAGLLRRAQRLVHVERPAEGHVVDEDDAESRVIKLF